MLRREKWYIVCNETLSAGTTIEGIRTAKTLSARKLDVVPVEYFGAVSPDRFDILINRGDIQPYKPSDNELELLYTCYPACIPKGAKFKVKADGIMAYARAWYQLNDAMPYGLAALVDIAGVCKVGDVVMAGEIVPAKFFAALSLEQFQLLEHYGLMSLSRYEALSTEQRGKIKPNGYLARYAPNVYELQGLHERFPAMSPQIEKSVSSEE